MSILAWIVVGLIAGWLAGEVMKGSGYGLIGNVIIGIVGGLLGGFIATRLLGVADPVTGFNLPTLIAAFLGAVVLIWIIRLLPGRSPV